MWPLITRENVKYQEIAQTLLLLSHCLGICDFGNPIVCCMLISGYSSLGLRDWNVHWAAPARFPGSASLLSPTLEQLVLGTYKPLSWGLEPSPVQLSSVHQSFEERQPLSGSVGSLPCFPRTKKGQAWESLMIKNKTALRILKRLAVG